MIQSLLIDLSQHFSADVFLTRRLTAHQSARGRNNIHSIAAQHARNLMRADINASARPRDPRQISDRGGTARVVTQKNADYLLRALAFDDEVVDIALLFKDAGDF